MGITTHPAGRRKISIGLVSALVLGSLVILNAPARAGHGDACLNVEPETASNVVGTTHTLTATILTPPAVNPTQACGGTGFTNAAAVVDTRIDFEVESGPDVTVQEDEIAPPDRPVDVDDDLPSEPDMTCVIPQGESSCVVLFTSEETGTNQIRGWVRHDTIDEDEPRDEAAERPPMAIDGDEPDATDVVQKTWTPGAGRELDCEPETDTNPTGDAHTVDCTVTDEFGNGIGGEIVDAEATGANDPDAGNTTDSPDFTCETDANGECSFTHGPGGTGSTNSQGTTTYRAWIDEDDDDGTFEGDAAETRAEDDTDDTDVVEKNWTAAPLNCNPEDDLNPTGTPHTITCTYQENGAPAAGQRIHAEATGANDPDGGSNTPNNPDFTCTTQSDNPQTPNTNETGTCSFTHGPGGTGSTPNVGTTTYRAWVDDDNNPNTFNGDASEGLDETNPAQAGSVAEGDNTDVVQKRWGASRLDCTPETDTNPAGTSHSVVCEARTQGGAIASGVNIDVEATGANDPDGTNSRTSPDFTCTTSTDGRCTITHGPGGTGDTNDGGTTTYRAWIDLDNNNATDDSDSTETQVEGSDPSEPDDTDVVSKTWIASRLDCSPESDTNPAGSAHTVTCTGTDAAGVPQAGMNVDVEATGANDPDGANSPTSPDFTCTTGALGQCSFTHGPGGAGTTTDFGQTLYRAWIDADANDATTEADPSEGRDETTGASPTASPSASPSPSPSSTPGAGTRSEPDDTDVVEKNWSATPTTIQIDPETDSAPVGSCNPFTITATDDEDEPVQNVTVDVEQLHTLSGNATPNDEPTVAFCTPGEADGANPSSVDPTRGDLGDGSDGTIGGETTDQTDAQGKVTIGVRVTPGQGSDGTGDVLVTAFYENEDNDDPDPGDPQDSATKTWTPSQARAIDCEPETARNRTGTDHVVTCTVTGPEGEAIQGEGVTFTEEGPGRFVTPEQTNTDSQGRARATVTSDEVGTQTITGTLTGSSAQEADECDKPAGDPPGAPAGQCSDSVEKTWTAGRMVTSGPCKGFARGTRTARPGGGRVIVGTGGNDVLRGTRNNDIICGLGGRDMLIGRGGNDLLSGGEGRDTLKGGAGNDRLQGNGGDDRLVGGRGDDSLKGHGGADILKGGNGKDRLRGGAGPDSLNGGSGTDSCAGGPGSDNETNCEP